MLPSVSVTNVSELDLWGAFVRVAVENRNFNLNFKFMLIRLYYISIIHVLFIIINVVII